jgi:hypothetical protein
LAARHGDTVWETTHVGGDRFAANVVCLPYGTYHGGVDTDCAATVGAWAVDGQVSLPHYRGRAGLPEAVQSAEWFARRETGVTGVHEVRFVRSEPVADATTTVEFEVTGPGLVRVTVRRASAGASRLTSCADGGSCSAPDYHALVAVDLPASASRASR